MPDHKVSRARKTLTPSEEREAFLKRSIAQLTKAIKAMVGPDGMPKSSTATAWTQAHRQRSLLHGELVQLRQARAAEAERPTTAEEDLAELIAAIGEMPEATVERIHAACKARLATTDAPGTPRLTVVHEQAE